MCAFEEVTLLEFNDQNDGSGISSNNNNFWLGDIYFTKHQEPMT